MLSSLQIEALAHGCAACSRRFADRDLCCAVYHVRELRSFEKQIELGIIGANVRNYWVHSDCSKPCITNWDIMTPDLHSCVRCKRALDKNHVVQPVFQVTDPKAVNPNDPEDVGVALNDRVYFLHADCDNPGLNKNSSNILLL